MCPSHPLLPLSLTFKAVIFFLLLKETRPRANAAPHPCNLSLVKTKQCYIPSTSALTGEASRSGIQGHPRLYGYFEVSLLYVNIKIFSQSLHLSLTSVRAQPKHSGLGLVSAVEDDLEFILLPPPTEG